MLLKNPGFTLVAALTLALGIGANSALFSVVNAFLLRPLPVKDPGQLMVLANSHPENDRPHGISYLDFQEYRAQSDAFTGMVALNREFVGLSTEGRADRVFAEFVSGDYFSFLGVQPAMGRFFLPEEGKNPGADPVVVLGNAYWRQRFGGDPSVVGKTVNVNGHACTIVGVSQENFHGTFSVAETQAYLPLGMAAIAPTDKELFTKRDFHALDVLARVKPGMSRSAAEASLQVIAQRLDREYPATDKGIKMHVIPEHLARPSPQNGAQLPIVASVFLGLVGLVLLVACVNVVNLLLARASVRYKEIAIRAALGARRVRLVRQMLTESLMLASLGGAAGAAVGAWVSRMLAGIQLPGDLPFRMDFSMDWRVFAYSAAAALAAGLISGLLPALRASRADVHDVLREGGRGAGTDGHHRLRDALVVAQVAGSLVLLAAAGLFVRSLRNAHSVELGFRPDHVVLMNMDPAQQGYDETRTRGFYRELEQRVRALPGVVSATLSSTYPMSYENESAYVRTEDQAPDAAKKNPITGYNTVGTDYFETVRTPIVLGRALNAQDQDSALRVAVINESMARRLWPGQSPIGKHFYYDAAEGKPVEVVGVSKDGKYQWMFEDPLPYFYLPIGQQHSSQRVLQIRTQGNPQDWKLMAVKQIHALDPALPVYDVLTMEEALGGGNGFFLLNMGAGFAGALGGLGLVLALVGVYGVVSYAASRRTHEIGIRMALGADRSKILGMVLRQGFGLALAGIGVGIVVALGLARFLSNMLFGIRPSDPVTFSVVALLLGAISMVACYLPARRATRVDPLVALRYE
jgi:predicted permease